MSRAALIATFLARHGYADARTAPLAQDASFRRYLRLTGGPRPAVLMDAPPPEDVRPFLRIAAHLAAIGLSVPEIIAADEANGLLLEEDLGDDCCLRDTPPEAHCGCRGATPWSRCSAPRRRMDCRPGTPPPWHRRRSAPCSTGGGRRRFMPRRPTTPAPTSRPRSTRCWRRSRAGPPCFVHRDYFAGNLIWLPRRRGPRRIGVLDFQSAAIGHPAYDLVSLLQDARRDIPPALAAPRAAPLSRRPAGARSAGVRGGFCRLRGATPSARRLPMGAPGATRRPSAIPAYTVRAPGGCCTPRCAIRPPRRLRPRWIAGFPPPCAATRRGSPHEQPSAHRHGARRRAGQRMRPLTEPHRQAAAAAGRPGADRPRARPPGGGRRDHGRGQRASGMPIASRRISPRAPPPACRRTRSSVARPRCWKPAAACARRWICSGRSRSTSSTATRSGWTARARRWRGWRTVSIAPTGRRAAGAPHLPGARRCRPRRFRGGSGGSACAAAREREIVPYVYAGVQLIAPALLAGHAGWRVQHEPGLGSGDRRRPAARRGA